MTNNRLNSFTIALALTISLGIRCHAAVVDFEDVTSFTGTSGNSDGQAGGQFYNGDSGIGTNTNGWTSGGTLFNNSYNSSFGGFWSGWAYSNVVNPVTAGFGNQYAAAPGGGSAGNGGVDAGGTYAIGFGGGTNFVNLPAGMQLSSVDITNSTYARLSMLNGDAFAKRFGGATGNDADFLRVTFSGFDGLGGSGNAVGTTTASLADYTFADNSQDFILSDWTTLDLSGLAGARSLSISFESSDVGAFGINTPTYVAVDNLAFAAVPEPGSLLLLLSFTAAAGLKRRRPAAA